MHTPKFRAAAVPLAVLAIPALSHAVIVIDGAGLPSRNLSAPTGTLADSGWQYQGNWGSFSGTPISADCFITAAHINPDSPSAPDRPDAVLGSYFTIGGVSYKTISYDSAPNADLRIWHIQGAFPANVIAPLYTGSSEAGQSAMIFGRGVPASSTITVGGNLKGWGWTISSYDGAHSWGRNIVDGTFTDPTYGRILVTYFDPIVGQDEGQLAYGDSSGGTFINDGGTWKLAGINFTADGSYKYALTDPSSFNAALFDQSGLYWQTGPTTFAPAPNQPAASYLTSISGNLDWINATIPEPGTLSLVGVASLLLLKRGR